MPRLSSIADIRMGATLRGRDATRPVTDGSYRFVRIGDVSQDGTLRSEDFIRIEPNEPLNEELCLRPGDILFPNRGTRTTALAFRLNQPRTIVGAQFFILRVDKERVLPEYVAWFLRSEESGRYFESHRKGTYVQIIQRSALAELEIPLPPLEVQQTIVQVSELAVVERDLTERLANLKWLCANENLVRTARKSAKPKPKALAHESDRPR